MPTSIKLIVNNTWTAISTTKGLTSNQNIWPIYLATGTTTPTLQDYKGHPLKKDDSKNFNVVDDGETLYAWCNRDTEIVVTES